MSSRGLEAGLNVVPISTRDLEWTLRTTYQHNVQYVDKLNVPAFNPPGGNFGVSYGRNHIAVGTRSTYDLGQRAVHLRQHDGNGAVVVVTTGC